MSAAGTHASFNTCVQMYNTKVTMVMVIIILLCYVYWVNNRKLYNIIDTLGLCELNAASHVKTVYIVITIIIIISHGFFFKYYFDNLGGALSLEKIIGCDVIVISKYWIILFNGVARTNQKRLPKCKKKLKTIFKIINNYPLNEVFMFLNFPCSKFPARNYCLA